MGFHHDTGCCIDCRTDMQLFCSTALSAVSKRRFQSPSQLHTPRRMARECLHRRRIPCSWPASHCDTNPSSFCCICFRDSGEVAQWFEVETSASYQVLPSEIALSRIGRLASRRYQSSSAPQLACQQIDGDGGHATCN